MAKGVRKPTKPAGGRRAGETDRFRETDVRPLTPERAFVVQFRANAGALDLSFDGRAERIMTGRVTRFSSASELIEFLATVLAEK